jgi:hypothetical protein
VQFWYRHRKNNNGVQGENKDLGAVWYRKKWNRIEQKQ